MSDTETMLAVISERLDSIDSRFDKMEKFMEAQSAEHHDSARAMWAKIDSARDAVKEAEARLTFIRGVVYGAGVVFGFFQVFIISAVMWVFTTLSAHQTSITQLQGADATTTQKIEQVEKVCCRVVR